MTSWILLFFFFFLLLPVCCGCWMLLITPCYMAIEWLLALLLPTVLPPHPLLSLLVNCCFFTIFLLLPVAVASCHSLCTVTAVANSIAPAQPAVPLSSPLPNSVIDIIPGYLAIAFALSQLYHPSSWLLFKYCHWCFILLSSSPPINSCCIFWRDFSLLLWLLCFCCLMPLSLRHNSVAAAFTVS